MSDWLNVHRLGTSMAASWAWGASLAVGISVLLTMGFWPFMTWAGFNVLAVPAFGLFYRYYPGFKEILKHKVFAAFMLFVQVFAIWMNMQAIYDISTGGLAGGISGFWAEGTAMTFVMVLAASIALLIHHFGFLGSLISDQLQYWGMTAVLAVATVVGGYVTGWTPSEIPTAQWGDIQWAWVVGIGLIAGPPMDAMQWERIEKTDAPVKASMLGGLYFGAYLTIVGLCALFLYEGLLIVSFVFLASLLIDTSTLDSSASAKQFLVEGQFGGRRIHSLLFALAVIAAWPLILELGVVMLQTIYSTGRLVVFYGMALPYCALVYFLLPRYAPGYIPSWVD